MATVQPKQLPISKSSKRSLMDAGIMLLVITGLVGTVGLGLTALVARMSVKRRLTRLR